MAPTLVRIVLAPGLDPDPMDNMFEKLLDWQRHARASAGGRMHATVHSYCRFLVDNDVSLCRATLAMETLHPQIQALRYVWYDDERDGGKFPSPALFRREVHHLDGCTIDEALMSHGARDTEPFRRSPFYRLIMGAPSVNIRLRPGVEHEFPVLDDLAKQGGTHYIALPLPGMDSQLSLATRAPGGFSDSAISLIELSLPVLALLIDGPLKDLVLDTVLSCYVGALPAEQIKRGNIRPGGMLDIHGAIWFSDIRNYSTHTQNTAADVFITRLNAYYECVVPIIYAHGGEVLKFIGDAVLAIFADDDSQSQDGCRRALSAALASNQALVDRSIDFDHGIGLHVGRFQFGNIGSLRRLDFTVIGNEVNVAARIEAQCKVLRQRLLMSESFVARCDMPVRLVATVPLKGIDGDFGLFVTQAGDAHILHQ